MRLAWPKSLIGRILIAEVAAVVLVCLLLPFTTSFVLRQTIARFQDETMVGQAQAVVRGIRAGAEGVRVVLDPTLQSIFATGYDGRAYVIVDGRRHPLAASAFGPQRLPAIPLRRAAACFAVEQLVGCSLPVATRSPALWVVVTQDQNGPGAILDDIATSFLLRYLVILVAVLMLLPLGTALLLRRLEQRVTAVSHDAALIGPFNLHLRLDRSGLPTEIAVLVQAMNRLLARLEASFSYQRAFAGDVAHELRTPLATLRLAIDALPDGATQANIAGQVDRMAHILSQLRDLAAVESNIDLTKAVFDLPGLAIEVVSDHAPAILARNQTISLTGNEVPIPLDGNRLLIAVALANLVNNASRHTPPGTQIEVTVLPGGVSVADNGPVEGARTLQRIAGHNSRADERTDRSAGLGLSIVQRILDVHDGRLIVAARDGGGSQVTMRFARAPGDAEEVPAP